MDKRNLSTDMLDTMEPGALAELDPETLDALFWLVSEENTVAKRHDKRLNDALEARYGSKASEALLKDGRDTGTVHLPDGHYDVAVTRPKRVKWDQAKLVEALNAMPPETAKHYAKAAYSIEERKFEAAPPDVQALLRRARTVETGKPSYSLAKKEAA